VGASLGIATRPVAAKPIGVQVSQAPKPVEITLVSFAVTRAAYDKIIPKFVADWKKRTGQDVKINTSYGGSGSQTRAVIDGLQADVVALALAGDTTKIQKAGLIRPGWERELPNNSIVTTSVVALITRPGNPKNIRTWQDLDNPGVRVITANPKTSGGARWNFIGLWGSVTENGGNEAQAQAFVQRVYRNAPVLGKDAREVSDIFFNKNQGDVLLNYEHEVILAAQQGERSTYVIPATNISIENPVAVVDQVVDRRGTRQVAEAFAKFLFAPTAQQDYVSVGFRPTNAAVQKATASRFPKVTKLYTVREFGGWEAIDKKFFADGGIFDQIFTR
jgi:sulfate transport system substrate-binding protein